MTGALTTFNGWGDRPVACPWSPKPRGGLGLAVATAVVPVGDATSASRTATISPFPAKPSPASGTRGYRLHAATLNRTRSHWEIKNKSRYPHDAAYCEDNGQTWTGNSPQVLASIRNLRIDLIRMKSISSFKEATKWIAGDQIRSPFDSWLRKVASVAFGYLETAQSWSKVAVESRLAAVSNQFCDRPLRAIIRNEQCIVDRAHHMQVN